jgi:hypothetical protein
MPKFSVEFNPFIGLLDHVQATLATKDDTSTERTVRSSSLQIWQEWAKSELANHVWRLSRGINAS